MPTALILLSIIALCLLVALLAGNRRQDKLPSQEKGTGDTQTAVTTPGKEIEGNGESNIALPGPQERQEIPPGVGEPNKGKDPTKSGGRLPGSVNAIPETPATPKKTVSPTDFVCRKEGFQWKLGKENDDGDFEEIVEIKGKLPLVFKLIGREMKNGIRVKSVSYGMYLAVVPEGWKRNEAQSGLTPNSPEQMSIRGYQAHYFFLETGGTERIAFDTLEGGTLSPPSNAPRFELRGNRIPDFDENRGLLFGEQPPLICALQGDAWQSVEQVVVGEIVVTPTGNVKYGKRMSFKPDPELLEQQLPSEIQEAHAGWYFLRFYDENVALIESLDFRFLGALKAVKYGESRCLPQEDGHKPVQVELLHEAGCIVQPRDSKVCGVQVEHRDDRTILLVPPRPDCDRTLWLVRGKDEAGVEVTVLAERIWWAEGIENAEPDNWQDRPIQLHRDDFCPTSNKALWIRLPRERWAESVQVGFEQARSRTYRVGVTKNTASIPLRDFGGSEELEKPGKHPFVLWVKNESAALASVEIKLKCRWCEFCAFNENELLNHVWQEHKDFVFPTGQEGG